MEWLQICKMIISWVNEHNVKNNINLYHLNVMCDTISK